MAIDSTLVSAHHCDGTPLKKADTMNGIALQHANRFPELCGLEERARLVLIAGEVGGRWSREAQAFLQCLVHGKAHSAPRILRSSAQAAPQVEQSVGLALHVGLWLCSGLDRHIFIRCTVLSSSSSLTLLPWESVGFGARSGARLGAAVLSGASVFFLCFCWCSLCLIDVS